MIYQEEILANFFVKNNLNYNLHPESELLLSNFNTVFKGQSSISYFYLMLVIWKCIPIELRKPSYYQVFRSEMKKWLPGSFPCRLCNTT